MPISNAGAPPNNLDNGPTKPIDPPQPMGTASLPNAVFHGGRRRLESRALRVRHPPIDCVSGGEGCLHAPRRIFGQEIAQLFGYFRRFLIGHNTVANLGSSLGQHLVEKR